MLPKRQLPNRVPDRGATEAEIGALPTTICDGSLSVGAEKCEGALSGGGRWWLSQARCAAEMEQKEARFIRDMDVASHPRPPDTHMTALPPGQ